MNQMSSNMRKRTFSHVQLTKTQICSEADSDGVREVQSNPNLTQNFIFMENFGKFGTLSWNSQTCVKQASMGKPKLVA